VIGAVSDTVTGPDQRSIPDLLQYLLVLSRPRFWLYLAGPVAVGVTYGIADVSELFTPVTVGLAAYFLVPANVFLYGVNDAFDADIDELNPKKEGREARWRATDSSHSRWSSPARSGSPYSRSHRESHGRTSPASCFSVPATAPRQCGSRRRRSLDSVSNGLYILPGAAAYAAVSGTHPPIAALAGAWLWAMGMHTFSIPRHRAGPRRRDPDDGDASGRGGPTRTASPVGSPPRSFAAVDIRLGVLLGVYPVFAAWVARSSIAVDRAYWWFPALNTAVGTLLAMGDSGASTPSRRPA